MAAGATPVYRHFNFITLKVYIKKNYSIFERNCDYEAI